MAIRVPLLLRKSVAVIHRLDTLTTRSFDPPGDPDAGYDDLLSEDVAYDSGVGTTRATARQEFTAVRVPCQVEAVTFEDLQQYGPGIVENSVLRLVTHRRDLESLGLIDATTRATLLKKSDRVSSIENPDGKQMPLAGEGLYIFEVRPGSFGFGDDGHDLEILFLEDRQKAQSA